MLCEWWMDSLTGSPWLGVTSPRKTQSKIRIA
jgi:hypothetical protein